METPSPKKNKKNKIKKKEHGKEIKDNIHEENSKNDLHQKKNKDIKKGKKTHPKKHEKNKEMENILSDPRFAHVPYDPKLRHIPKEERKIKIDSRFSSMFEDDKFYEKSTMDPRGRSGNFSTKEDLRRFYQLSDEEDSADESDVSSEDEKDAEEKNAQPELSKDGVAKEEKEKEIIERLQDMTQDYARGLVLFSDDSSEDDSSTDDEAEEDEFEWGELDNDAVWDGEKDFEETKRIAVCNLDWNHLKAVDIMVLFNSFCPRGGSVQKVTIFLSQFGKERMAEEDRYGPKELVSESINDRSEEIDLEKLEKGKLDFSGQNKSRLEALRRYERNRLKYYYAVVECDSIETATTLYKEVDRQFFERSAGILMDLRYIPDDMTFDEQHHDICTSVPEFYQPKYFTTTALFNTQPTLTWDQTDPHRQKAIHEAMKKSMTGDINDDQLKGFIASSSEDEDSSLDVDESEEDSNDEDEETGKERAARFRKLMQEIDKKEKAKANRFNMESVFGEAEGEEEDDDNDEQDDDSEDDKKEIEKDKNPFEKYLEKRREKKKEKQKKKKKKEAKHKELAGESHSEEESSQEIEFSDDELPGGLDGIYNDPFFAEELNKRGSKDKPKKKKTKKDKNSNEEEQDNGDKDNLELLLMDEDHEEDKHFSMRDIIDEHKLKSKKKLKKKAKEKLEEKRMKKNAATDEFKIDVKDSRFSHLISSGEYNIDPSHPQFKRTKAMDNLITEVQKKRIADSNEVMPDTKRMNTNKGKDDHELSLLIKKVKGKTNNPKKKIKKEG